MSTDSNAKSIIEQPVQPQFGGSFHDTEGDRARLTPGELLVMNLESQGAAAIALGARPHLERIRPQIVTQLPHFDIARFDKIGTFAEALFYANIGLRAASGTGGALVTVMARAGALLDTFLTDTPALEKRGLIDGAPLREIKRSPGYLNTATELGVVVRVLRADWPKIEGKTAIQAAELDEAEAICERLTLEYAGRSNATTEHDDAADERQRAYTLLVGAYDQARRAATYLRWDENDVDDVLPSLWAGRARPAKASDAQAPAAATDPTAATKRAGSVTPKAGTAEGPAAAPAHAASPAAGAPAAGAPAPAPVGMPGSSPFTTN